MRMKFIVSVAVITSVFLAGPAVSATPFRIMCLGDSITVGATDAQTWTVPFEFGYRSGLYTRLTDAGYSFLFVGGSTEPWIGPQSDPTLGGTVTPTLDLREFGQDGHRGYGGTTVSFLNANILSWLASDDPDIILLKIGTNAQDTSGLNTLVNTIVTTQPDARLIIAEIIPKYTYQQGIVDYNTYIRETLVPNFQAQGKHVTGVDQYVNFLTDPQDLTSINTSLFSNGINHPDNDGYALMAQTWFQAVQSIMPPHIVDAGVDMITWSGEPVQLASTLVSINGGALPAGLIYAWSADPGAGVVFSATDVQSPTVTITKAAGDPLSVTLTLAVSDGVTLPSEDTMTVDVYDDACLAAIGKGLRAENRGDIDGNCKTDIEDLVQMSKKWLTEITGLPGPVPKP